MTKKMGLYKCELCGNIVEVLHEGAGELVCCGQPMNYLEEKTADTTQEKHVPFIEVNGDKVTVKVGQNAKHPMEEKHYIEWIELIADGIIYTKFLKPGDEPEAVFTVKASSYAAREYCNIHGAWKS